MCVLVVVGWGGQRNRASSDVWVHFRLVELCDCDFQHVDTYTGVQQNSTSNMSQEECAAGNTVPNGLQITANTLKCIFKKQT